MSRDSLYCPFCEHWVAHDRGYLVEHYTERQRGALTTGKTLCDGSNRKFEADLKTVKFTGTCPNCLNINVIEFTEKFPGSLDKYGGVITQNCVDCGPEGHYCSNCDHLLHEKKVPNQGDPVLLQALQNIKYEMDSDPNTALTQVDVDQASAAFLASQLNGDVTIWVDKGGDRECPDGEDHEPVHREYQDRPVVLTDSHVIKEGAEE